MSTDIVISFDTTGSMSPCIAEVRRKVDSAVSELFDHIPDLRIGLIAHGDWCDMPRGYFQCDLTTDRAALKDFILQAPNTGGGDGPEFYEYVIHQASKFGWRADHKSLVMIADNIPHEPGYSYRGETHWYDWVEEARGLAEKNVSIYAVEALGSRYYRNFYGPLAEMTNGRALFLNQFSDAVEALTAISYHATGDIGLLDGYKEHLEANFKMNRGLAELLHGLDVRVDKIADDASGLIRVNPFRFQMVHVDNYYDIRSFVESIGAKFKKGRGFYQLSKNETVQEMKEVILRNRFTGDMFTGEQARIFIGLPFGTRGTVNPRLLDLDTYEVYVQSTSVNRKLMPGTKFLYENEEA